MLAALRGSETFAFVTASSADALAGAVVTEARLHRASWIAGTALMETATIVGVSRFRVSAVAGRRPHLMLRGARLPDAPPGGEADDATSREEALRALRDARSLGRARPAASPPPDPRPS